LTNLRSGRTLGEQPGQQDQARPEVTMAKYTWRVGSGDLALAADWINATTGQNPAPTPPGSGDDASFNTPGGTVPGPAAVNSLTVNAGAVAPWTFTGQVTANTAFLAGATALAGGGTLLLNPAQKSAYLLAIGQSSGSQAAAGGSLVVDGAGSVVDGGAQGGASLGQLGGSGALTISNGGAGRFATTNLTDAAALAVGRVGTGVVTVTGQGSSLALTGGFYAGRATGSSGTITVSAGGALTQAAAVATDAVTIGDGGTVNGTFLTGGKGELDIVGGGAATLAQQVLVGGNGATGVVLVSDAGSQLVLGDTLNVGTGTAAPGGAGTLVVQAGGTVRMTAAADPSRSFLLAGSQVGTTGTITVSGSGSVLDVGKNAASIGNIGAGSLTVSDGGTLRSATSDSRVQSALFAGNAAGSNGAITVTGAGSSIDANGYTYVGRGGTGTLLVDQKGSFTGGSAASGDGTGANAAFGIAIGDETPTLSFRDVTRQPAPVSPNGGTGGVKVLNGGTLSSRAGLRVGYGDTPGTLLIDGGSLVQAAGAIYAGSARITVQGGSTLRSAGPHTAGSSSIQVEGRSASMTVSGPGSLLDAGGDGIDVGDGTLDVLAGATATGGNTLYANPANEAGFSLGSQGGTGRATVTGAGSLLAINGSLTIGGTATAAGGRGTLAAGYGGVARGTSAILYSGSLLYAEKGGLIQIGTGSTTATDVIAVLAGSSLVAHGGTIATGVLDDGTLSNDGALLITGSVSGAGALTLRAGMADIRGSIGGQALSFTSPTAALRVRGLRGATTATGFQAGNMIDLANVATATLTDTANGTVLAGGGGTINLGTAPAGAAFKLFSDGRGGTEVLLPPAAVAVQTIIGASVLFNGYSAGAASAVAAALTALAGPSGTVATLSSRDGAFGAATPGVENVAVVVAPADWTVLTLPTGYRALVAQGSRSVTLSDAGTAGAVLIGGGGTDRLESTGAGATLIGGQGTNSFIVSGSAKVTTGDGTNTIDAVGSAAVDVTTGAGKTTVRLGNGASSVRANGQDTVLGGAGTCAITATGGVTAVGRAGAMTFLGGSATSIVFGGSGGVNYTAGSAYDIVVGVGGPITVQGGSGGGQFWGNGGGDVIRAGSGQAVLFGSNGDKLYSAGSAGDFLVAGAGDVLLDGSASTGNDAFFGGNGRDTFIAGSGNVLIGTGSGTSTVQLGAGKDTVFAFGTSTITSGAGSADIVFGTTAGQLVIGSGAARTFALFNFVPGAERITLQGYDASTAANALANQVSDAAQTVLTLGDGSIIQLIGVARADASFFG